MIFLRIITFLLAISLFFEAQAQSTKVYSHNDIYGIIQKVSQGDKASLEKLMYISLNDHPITLTQDIVKVVVFGLITTNQTAKLNAYLKKVNPGLTSFMNDKKINHDCKECEGEGTYDTKCKKCIFGKCYNCKGEGYHDRKELGHKKGKEKKSKKKVVKSICEICHGTGKCLTCKGEGKLKRDCSHCNEGININKRSILQEMINSMQRITKQTESKVAIKTSSEFKANEELDQLFNQSVSIEQTDNNEGGPIEESGIAKAFKKTKSYIEGYESKNNKDICKDIKLNYLDDVPTLVLDISDGYAEKIESSKIREITGFKKYWEAQVLIYNYENQVHTVLMSNGVNINDKFTLIQGHERVK